MVRKAVQRALRALGYEVRRLPSQRPSPRRRGPIATPPPLEPLWPLPRRAGGPGDDEIRRAFARHDYWHYAYRFDGGLEFHARHKRPGLLTDAAERPLQRFRHFMPHLLAAAGGTLAGKRVLDIACNSGFWSVQCALLGARVVGIDARPELIEQARLVGSIAGAEGAEFRVANFWDLRSESLGGPFDIVLSLGILYHLAKPLEALELTRALAREHVLLDTAVYPSADAAIRLRWEEPDDIREAATAGVVAHPTRSAIELMLEHVGARDWFEIPLGTADMPRDYREGRRASWLIRV